MNFRPLLHALFLVLLLPAAVAAASSDAEQIRAVALDYIEGWYTQDPVRMERALHPQMLKRRVVVDPKTKATSLDEGGTARLVQATTPRPGQPARPLGTQRGDVRVLDVFGNVATVRIDAHEWVDYLHLIRWNGEWKIIHVLWELKDAE
jgi:hypothetical protein